MEYTWKVLESDVEKRCMLVEYASEGRQTFAISTRLPSVDEPLDVVIEMFAPLPVWAEADRIVVPVEAGLSGTKTVTTAPAVEEASAPEQSVSVVMNPVVEL